MAVMQGWVRPRWHRVAWVVGVWSAVAFGVAAHAYDMKLARQLSTDGVVMSRQHAYVFSPWLSPLQTERTHTLADLGLKEPVAVTGGAERTLYFPVPSGMALQDVRWRLDHRYLNARGEGHLSVSLVGETDFMGTLVPDGSPKAIEGYRPYLHRRDGFLPLTVKVLNGASPASSLPRSTDQCALVLAEAAASLEIEPSTRLSFRFAVQHLPSSEDAWALLPRQPVVLLPGAHLDAEAYEAAWRVGAALKAAGKTPVYVALPSVGSDVGTTGLQVPSGLRLLPAFAAFSAGGSARLGREADVLAWLLLQVREAGGLHVVIASAGLQDTLRKGVDQLRAQVQASLPAAQPQFDELVERLMALADSGASFQASDVAVRRAPTGPVFWVTPAAAVSFAQLARARGAGIPSEAKTLASAGVVLMSSLMAPIGTYSMLDRVVWRSRFQIGDALLEGRYPDELVLDIQTPPTPGKVNPIASVYLNDVLLTATQLFGDADGERIKAAVPRSALRTQNEVRVVVHRQSERADCLQSLAPHPLTFMPSSHWVLGDPVSDTTFTGLAAQFSSGGYLYVPLEDLAQAPATLSRLVWLTHALMFEPGLVALRVGSVGESEHQLTPALMVGLSGAGSFVEGQTLLQARVDTVDGQPVAKVRWHSPPRDGQWPGNVGVFSGNVVQVDLEGRVWLLDDAGEIQDSRLLEVREPWAKRQMGWVVPLLLVLAFVVLLVAASRRRRKLT